MELNKTKKGIYLFISAVTTMVLLLGSWWLYLVFKLSTKLEALNHSHLEGNLLRMVKYEGFAFGVLLLTLMSTLLYIYFQDYKKTKSLQGFFSSLTHELKTPLASMKLQSQVLTDHIHDLNLTAAEKANLLKYTNRLINDNTRLEDQLDNHLQLSRVKRGAALNLRSINLKHFMQTETKRYSKEIMFDLQEIPEIFYIMVDDFALKTVFRNLIENSLIHTGKDPVQIKIAPSKESQDLIIYSDNGPKFDGDIDSLGKLFYKHNSPKGSGIGIYLIKKLMKSMNGECVVNANENLVFYLRFVPGKSHE